MTSTFTSIKSAAASAEVALIERKKLTASSDGISTAAAAAAAELSDVDCDCDSLLSSDGKEKADATPENLKKIDDVIALSNNGTTMQKINNDRNSHCCSVFDNNRQQNAAESVTITEDDEDLSAAAATTATITTTATTTVASAKQSLAFTIDNFSEKDCDPIAAAVKYKNMLERFKNRHRRGASMSKLEGGSATDTKTTTESTDKNKIPTKTTAERVSPMTVTTTTLSSKVKLRARDRSTSRVRDSSKRHSWSPRSSTNESSLQKQTAAGEQQQQQQQQLQKRSPAEPKIANMKSSSSSKQRKSNTKQQQSFMPRSTAMQIALQKIDFLCPQPPLADFQHFDLIGGDGDNISEAGTYTLDGDNYTEEQKDLMNIDRSNMNKAAAAAAVAATTQQRPKNLPISSEKPNQQAQRQNVLEVSYYHESESEILMRNLSQKSPLQQQQQQQLPSPASYLEKIRSRVLRNMSVASGKNDITHGSLDNIKSSKPPPAHLRPPLKESKNHLLLPPHSPSSSADDNKDIGTFTSVITSGVLAKQNTLDSNPKLTQRSSLSTSQIDSSEYVSKETNLNVCETIYSAGGFTDHQKAEYRLNLFTNQNESEGGGDGVIINSSPSLESPSSFTRNIADDSNDVAKLSDTAILKTASTKNDWIQEWALNARARSVVASGERAREKKHKKSAGSRQQLDKYMSRSYNCENFSTNDDNIFHLSQEKPPAKATIAACNNNSNNSNNQCSHHLKQKQHGDRFCLTENDFDYTSDPAISSAMHTRKSSSSTIGENSLVSSRPPKSPSKIPSPMHSIGRTRSASRTRASLQNMLHNDDNDEDYDETNRETDVYLQNTAAAISNLQQNLSQKNSLSSSSHGGSPIKQQQQQQQQLQSYHHHRYYSADEYSPQHSIDQPQQQHEQQQQQWAQRSILHKRNLSATETCRRTRNNNNNNNNLMVNSYNEQQLMMMMTTAKNYSPRPRKNSFDGQIQLLNTSPTMARYGKTSRGLACSQQYIDQTEHGSIKQQQRESSVPLLQLKQSSSSQQQLQSQSQTQLRRSSSFSVKAAAAAAAVSSTNNRPQYQQNFLFTPPATRHNYTLSQQQKQQQHQQQQQQQQVLPTAAASMIKKSASSTTFRQIYSDYDENVAYYINDEDDLIDDDFCSSENDEDDENDDAGGGGGNCQSYDKDYIDDEDGLRNYNCPDNISSSAGDNQNMHHDEEDDDDDDDEDVDTRNINRHCPMGSSTSSTAAAAAAAGITISNARYNKALLMRIENSKQKVAGTSSKLTSSGGSSSIACGGGVIACPNTPELPRRHNMKNLVSIPRASTARPTRQSMPRDTSLNRMGEKIPNSLASAKKQILQTAANVALSSPNSSSLSNSKQQQQQQQQQQRIQPKYLDISKYKPVQSNNFLRKNDSKSTLKVANNNDPSIGSVRRSPSSTTIVLNRNDSARISNRSTKSATTMPMGNIGSNSITGTRGGTAAAGRRDTSVSKQKEVELAMWKRRRSYDPMRAAAEDRRKKEEAKRLAQGGSDAAAATAATSTNVTESNSSMVARSQSFYSGSLDKSQQQQKSLSLETNRNRWTLTSTESSDEDDITGLLRVK